MTDDDDSHKASSGKPYKVGIMPTEDGGKVLIVLRFEQDDQMLFWFDAGEAFDLAEALIYTASQIVDQGGDCPPTKN